MIRKNMNQKAYDLWQLVDTRVYEKLGRSNEKIQFICDIDKTYLETAFESWVKMARIAFEGAKDKITVSGASDLLLAARWGDFRGNILDPKKQPNYPRPLHFVSSSPPQLRKVLEEKLAIDGLDWSSDTFKNQVYNIKKIRFGMLKQQVAYKTAAILKLIENQTEDTTYFLIGDNAETDPFIYVGIKLLVEGKLNQENFEKYLGLLGVEHHLSTQLWEGLNKIPKGRISAILIRNISTYSYFSHPPISDPIYLFESFFDVGLFLYIFNVIETDDFWTLFIRLHNRHGVSLLTMSKKILNYLENTQDTIISEKLKSLLPPSLLSSLTNEQKESRYRFYKNDLKSWSELNQAQILNLAKKWIDKTMDLKKSH